jgi:hypothetical protein
MSNKVYVELTISANVEVTDEVKNGMKEQYGYTDKDLENDELVGRAMLFASINPRLPRTNFHSDDFWDGVANMRGLITEINLWNSEDE